MKKIRLGMAVCVVFCVSAQGVHAGSRAETEFREEGANILAGAPGDLLSKPATNFSSEAFSQSKTPAVPESEVNLHAPLAGRAADMQMFLFLMLAICGVVFLGLVVVSATQKGKSGGVRVHRSGSGEEESIPELHERRRRRRRHSSPHADPTPRVQT